MLPFLVNSQVKWLAVGRKYNGQFGEWTLEESDRQEVLGYRTGLSLAAVGIPDSSLAGCTYAKRA